MIISVIMLTYNRAALVGRAIESILSQTFTNFEFIIVDNGSTDKSGVIADEYAAKDERIRVIHMGRGSISEGRNAGLDAAKGEYVTFIDDDDWTEPDFLGFLYNLAVENSADVSICGAVNAVYDEKKIMSPVEALRKLMGRKYFGAAFPTKLFRRKMFDNNRFPKEGRFDDIALMYKLLANANKVAYYGLPKYTFYRHEGNHSAWTTNHSLLDAETLKEYLRVYRERTEYLCEKFPDNAANWEYFEWSFMISMVEKVSRLEIKDCYQLREIMCTELSECHSEFLSNEMIQDFELEWFDKYIVKGEN